MATLLDSAVRPCHSFLRGLFKVFTRVGGRGKMRMFQSSAYTLRLLPPSLNDFLHSSDNLHMLAIVKLQMQASI